jgi:hypothetical protein
MHVMMKCLIINDLIYTSRKKEKGIKAVEQCKLSHIFDWIVKWYDSIGKQFGIFLNIH